MKHILVTYASKHGSTEEIALRIANRLQLHSDFSVDISPIHAAKHIEEYDALVIGSAIYMGKWLPEVTTFLIENTHLLSQRNVWLFASGPTEKRANNAAVKKADVPEEIRFDVKHINPRDIVEFYGRLDPSQLSFLEKVVVRIVGAEAADYRDWENIDLWADGIAANLKALEPLTV